MNVLVVDDDPIARKAVSRPLEAGGYVVTDWEPSADSTIADLPDHTEPHEHAV